MTPTLRAATSTPEHAVTHENAQRGVGGWPSASMLDRARGLVARHGDQAEDVVDRLIDEWWETGDEGELSECLSLLYALDHVRIEAATESAPEPNLESMSHT